MSAAKEKDSIFAERCLLLRSETTVQEIVVQFGPAERQGDAASCRYSVMGAGGTITEQIWGIDLVQAIQLAMTVAASDLDRIAGGGTYTIAGDHSGSLGHGLA